MREVWLEPCRDKELIKVYGPAYYGSIWLPDGISGADLWAKCKQTEEERRECIKRGAEFLDDLNKSKQHSTSL
jgi:hypothetical protein